MYLIWKRIILKVLIDPWIKYKFYIFYFSYKWKKIKNNNKLKNINKISLQQPIVFNIEILLSIFVLIDISMKIYNEG